MIVMTTCLTDSVDQTPTCCFICSPSCEPTGGLMPHCAAVAAALVAVALVAAALAAAAVDTSKSSMLNRKKVGRLYNARDIFMVLFLWYWVT